MLLSFVAAAEPPDVAPPLRFEPNGPRDYSVVASANGYRLTFGGNRAAAALDITITRHPGALALHYQGQDRLAVDAEGNLVISARGREIIQPLPAVFQRDAQSLRLISAAYVIGSNGNVGLRLGPYDHTRPIEIAPLIVRP